MGECTKCERGTFADIYGEQCVSAKECGAGYIGNANGYCEKCEGETYANINKSKCVEAIQCGAGNIGDPYGNGNCEKCPEGYYASIDKTECTDDCGTGSVGNENRIEKMVFNSAVLDIVVAGTCHGCKQCSAPAGSS